MKVYKGLMILYDWSALIYHTRLDHTYNTTKHTRYTGARYLQNARMLVVGIFDTLNSYEHLFTLYIEATLLNKSVFLILRKLK